MPPNDGHDAETNPPHRFEPAARYGNVETMLFEALVHQLIEKGLLTKNDALSVVQTVAEVHRGHVKEAGEDPRASADVALLHRLYRSFEIMRDRSPRQSADQDNVLQLRPPLHGDAPEFPRDE